jgi:hypothetical protein
MDVLGLALDLVEGIPKKAQSNSLAVRAYLGGEALAMAVDQTRKIENKEKIVGIFVITEGSGAYYDSAIRFYTPTEKLKTYVHENYFHGCLDMEDAIFTFEQNHEGVEFFTI